LWAIDAAIEFLADAHAKRTIIAFGTISDCGPERSRAYRAVARRALAVADEVVFIGPNAHHVSRIETGSPLHAFASVREATEYFERSLGEGDLLLLKGSKKADHLQRIILARTREVRCWRAACGRDDYCDQCSLLAVPEQTGA
jgi:UDP-N-acetylmuramoyl-tripeptide--D-alanyl-D-alanine ligase